MPDTTKTITEQDLSSTNEKLANLFYQYAPATILTSQFIAIIITFTLHNQVNQTHLYAWLGSVTLFNLLRLGLHHHKARTRAAVTAWINHYLLLTLFAGLSWSLLLVMFDSSLPLYAQLLIIMTLICMPIASIPNNAVWLPVYYAFAGPNLLGLLIWSLLVVEGLSLEYGTLTIAYSIVLFITAHLYHRNLKDAVRARSQNERLVEELSRTNRQLEEFAYVDPLTGLTNRRWFQEQADNALERCQRHNSYLALLLIDLDNFKKINDELGHTAGDEVLMTVAKRLKGTFRQTDSIAHAQLDAARFGGDEFIILLEDIRSSDDVKKAAQRVLDEVNEPIKIGDHPIKPSCSLGIALYPPDGNTVATLIRRADVALYRAKDSGRNNYQFYDDTEALADPC
jgi:diguanylate cyclase (GGDEF)-like protein